MSLEYLLAVMVWFFVPAIALIGLIFLHFGFLQKNKDYFRFPVISSGVLFLIGMIATAFAVEFCRGSCREVIAFPIYTLIITPSNLAFQLLLGLFVKKFIQSKLMLVKISGGILGLAFLLCVGFLIVAPYDTSSIDLAEKAIAENKPQLCEKAGGIKKITDPQTAKSLIEGCYKSIVRLTGEKKDCGNLRGRQSQYPNGFQFDMEKECLLDLEVAQDFIKQQCNKDFYDINCLQKHCRDSRLYWSMEKCFNFLGRQDIKWCDKIKTLSPENDTLLIEKCRKESINKYW